MSGKPRGKPFQKGNAQNPVGRPKGAKSKLSESFYADCLAAYNDPRVGGIEGLVDFIVANTRNRMTFYAWLSKTIPANLAVTGKDGGPIQHQVFKTEYADDDPGKE